VKRACICVWLGVACSAAPNLARAQEPRARPPRSEDFLSWRAPPGCGAAAAIRERVTELLGQRELDLKQVERVEGRVNQTRDGWALELRLFDRFGVRERRLASRHCDDLAEAAAVAITLAFEAARSRAAEGSGSEGSGTTPLGPDRARAPVKPTPTPSPSPSAPPPESGIAGPASTDSPGASAAQGEHGEEAHTALGAELLVDAHSLPAVAIGPGVIGALRWDDLSVGLFAAWFPGAEKTVAPNQRAEFSLVVAGARVCYTLGHGLVDTALCAGFEAGQISARGAGLLEARSARDLWLAPDLGLALRAEPWSSFALGAHAEAFAPLLRQGYGIDQTENIYHVRSLGVRAGFGFLVGF
jgi:hypothetical protein